MMRNKDSFDPILTIIDSEGKQTQLDLSHILEFNKIIKGSVVQKFRKDNDGKFKCIIISGDIDYDTLDDKVKLYFEDNCKNYPSVKGPDRVHRIHVLPEKCTYRWTKVE